MTPFTSRWRDSIKPLTAKTDTSQKQSSVSFGSSTQSPNHTDLSEQAIARFNQVQDRLASLYCTEAALNLTESDQDQISTLDEQLTLAIQHGDQAAFNSTIKEWESFWHKLIVSKK